MLQWIVVRKPCKKCVAKKCKKIVKAVRYSQRMFYENQSDNSKMTFSLLFLYWFFYLLKEGCVNVSLIFIIPYDRSSPRVRYKTV